MQGIEDQCNHALLYNLNLPRICKRALAFQMEYAVKQIDRPERETL